MGKIAAPKSAVASPFHSFVSSVVNYIHGSYKRVEGRSQTVEERTISTFRSSRRALVAIEEQALQLPAYACTMSTPAYERGSHLRNR